MSIPLRAPLSREKLTARIRSRVLAALSTRTTCYGRQVRAIWIAALLLTACGRVGYDPFAGDDATAIDGASAIDADTGLAFTIEPIALIDGAAIGGGFGMTLAYANGNLMVGDPTGEKAYIYDALSLQPVATLDKRTGDGTGSGFGVHVVADDSNFYVGCVNSDVESNDGGAVYKYSSTGTFLGRYDHTETGFAYMGQGFNVANGELIVASYFSRKLYKFNVDTFSAPVFGPVPLTYAALGNARVGQQAVSNSSVIALGGPTASYDGATSIGSMHLRSLVDGSLVQEIKVPAGYQQSEMRFGRTLSVSESSIYAHSDYFDFGGVVNSGTVFRYDNAGNFVGTIDPPLEAQVAESHFSMGGIVIGSNHYLPAPGINKVFVYDLADQLIHELSPAAGVTSLGDSERHWTIAEGSGRLFVGDRVSNIISVYDALP